MHYKSLRPLRGRRSGLRKCAIILFGRSAPVEVDLEEHALKIASAAPHQQLPRRPAVPDRRAGLRAAPPGAVGLEPRASAGALARDLPREAGQAREHSSCASRASRTATRRARALQFSRRSGLRRCTIIVFGRCAAVEVDLENALKLSSAAARP